uniref:Uncharacterized protein n=1 Tax=Callorhinchus milii TaxID=7868 RepID=A0A4W3GPA4_CALMI
DGHSRPVVLRVTAESEQVRKDQAELRAQVRETRSSITSRELELTRWQVQHHQLSEHSHSLDIALAKLDNHCQLLTQLKGNLEEENHYLLSQVQTLNQQNHNLLERSMESREQTHEEQKQYM